MGARVVAGGAGCHTGIVAGADGACLSERLGDWRYDGIDWTGQLPVLSVLPLYVFQTS